MNHLLYVIDTYCGWCHGFGPAVSELAAGQDVSLEVIHGSLFPSNRPVPLGDLAHIGAANDRIAELTGATFGPGYRRLLEEGSFVMDSDAAALGLAALKRASGPGHDLRLARAMQQAFYLDGASLSDPRTYTELAPTLGIDPAEVLRRLADADTRESARSDQRRAARLGVTSYPTLAVRVDGALVGFRTPTSTAAQLRSALDDAIHGSRR